MSDQPVIKKKRLKKFKKGTIKIKETVPLSVVAANVGDTILSAIYSGMARKSVVGLEEGDELDAVVDHYVEHNGMADEMARLARIRLQIQLCVDLSGSMFHEESGKPIVPAMTVMRMFHTAFQRVKENLPPDVFRYNLWLWSVYEYGGYAVCLDNLPMGTFVPDDLKKFAKHGSHGEEPLHMSPLEVDQLLEGISMVKPYYRGTGTQLLPLIQGFRKWEENYGDPGAYRLDIVLSDGVIYDWKACSTAQVERKSGGKYDGVLLQIGHEETKVPEGYTMYQTKPQHLDIIVRDVLLEFLQKVL